MPPKLIRKGKNRNVTTSRTEFLKVMSESHPQLYNEWKRKTHRTGYPPLKFWIQKGIVKKLK